MQPAPATGTIVSVRLVGRRVRGWVLGRVTVPPVETIRSIERVVTVGPDETIVDLARFGAWRYAGPLRPFLKAASPDRIVRALPPPLRPPSPERFAPLVTGQMLDAVRDALGRPLAPSGAVVLRTGPAESRLGIVAATAGALGGRDLLVLVPEHRDAEILTDRLRRAGIPVAPVPDQWAVAAAGGSVVVGTRRAALCRVGDLGGVVVLDAHAESYVEERSPTANATVIVTERARRAGVPCLLVSPTPTLEQLAAHDEVVAPASRGWPTIEIIDRTASDPHTGAYDPRLASAIREALAADPRRRVVCVLNRTGRVRLLGCGACNNLQRCERCGHALAEPGRPEPGQPRRLVCPSCGDERPFVCDHCGSTRLRQVRIGVARVAEELSALVHEPAFEVTGSTGEIPPEARLLVGTEAVLHRVGTASLVAFVDFDQELLAARYRASEQAWVLLGRAARLLGGATSEGRRRIVVQTRLPAEAVFQAVRSGDPSAFLAAERARRLELRLPPFSALALVSGDDAGVFADAVRTTGATVEVAGRPDGTFLLRAESHAELLAAITAAELTGVRARIAVDPDGV